MRNILLPCAVGALALLLGGCGPSEPVSEIRLAQALEAIQQGRTDEASRLLAGIKGGGGWLRGPAWSAPLALRLRAQIAFRVGAREEGARLMKEYAGRYDDLAPAMYATSVLDFLKRFGEWQGGPASLYLRGLEAAEESPALAIKEWRNLLRDFPTCALAPVAQLKLGLLQRELGNAAWALSELTAVGARPLEAVDPDGNPVAPQALLAAGQTHFDLLTDRLSAARTLSSVATTYPEVVLKAPGGEFEYSPALMAKVLLARIALETGNTGEGMATLESLLNARGPAGFLLEGMGGDLKGEVRLMLAGACLRLRQFTRAREHLVEVAKRFSGVKRGRLDGPRRSYGFEAVDWLESSLGARASEEALRGLAEVAGGAKTREVWAYAQLKRVKLMARVGQRKAAFEVMAEMQKRYPHLECDPDGDGLLLVPAREAKRVVGG